MAAATGTEARDALLAQLACDHDEVELDQVELETSVPRRERQHVRALRELTVLRYRGRPRYVAKVPLGDDDGKVAAEYDKLRALGAHVAGCRPLRRAGAGFVMAYVPRADLPDLFAFTSPAQRRAACLAVVDAMVALQRVRTTQTPPRPGPPRPRQALRSYHIDAADLLGRPELDAVDRTCVGPAHGDLAAWNVRYDPATGRVGIVDWEDFRDVGLPALDVVNFLVTLAVVMHGGAGTWDDVFTRAFEQPGEYRQLASSCSKAWAARTAGSARDTLRLLPVYCEAMEQRIGREGRSTAHMFFATFAGRFAEAEPGWVAALDD